MITEIKGSDLPPEAKYGLGKMKGLGNNQKEIAQRLVGYGLDSGRKYP